MTETKNNNVEYCEIMKGAIGAMQEMLDIFSEREKLTETNMPLYIESIMALGKCTYVIAKLSDLMHIWSPASLSIFSEFEMFGSSVSQFSLATVIDEYSALPLTEKEKWHEYYMQLVAGLAPTMSNDLKVLSFDLALFENGSLVNSTMMIH